MSESMPTFDSLMNPLLEALFELGGSGSIDEIYEKVVELQKIDDELSSIPHNPEKSNLSEIGYRMAWARTYLKKFGFLENSTRGVWALTPLAREKRKVNPKDVVKKVREADKEVSRKKLTKTSGEDVIELIEDSEVVSDSWQEDLYHLLTKEMLLMPLNG